MGTYDFVIIATLVGFLALTYILLAPIWRFLDREQEASKKWTKKELARRMREKASAENGASAGNGASQESCPPDKELDDEPSRQTGSSPKTSSQEEDASG